MGKLKTLLRGAPLRVPSPALARRVAVAFDEAEARASGAPLWRLLVPLWTCVAVGLVCGLTGFLVSRSLTKRPPAVVYIVPAEGELRRILMGEAEPRPPEPPRIEVRLIKKEEL
jgi:hypothetical protein